MDTLKELYKIGCGPSSSHTMGPQRAARRYSAKHPEAESFRCTLYGSLAATGKGHLTDYIIIDAIKPKTVEIVWNEEVIPEFHPNGMMFEAIDKDGNASDPWTVFSVGGGTLAEEGARNQTDGKVYYEHSKLDDIIAYCKEHDKNFVEYVLDREDDDFLLYMESIADAMYTAIEKGIESREIIPGKLLLKRRASRFYKKYLATKDYTTLNYSFALAASEENASGGTIVTAPTCGSAGVLPGVFFSLMKHNGYSKQHIIEGLIVAGLIGNLIKTNASISGAEVGCQGEVGAACSMAAAGSAYLFGGTLEQIEYAAEIGLEHHLGMTCDPVYGYVQIPCIERNAMAAERSIAAAKYALNTDGSHTISFDQVTVTMLETGIDLMDKYRETAKGGLAKWFDC
ncbi:L-serine ammonia-lyase, iron-sulfur-dependent, subunit alpha [Peptostreptococcus equinus]|uniref:L-serine ammonia-lyase n=1 Tax=Peptostreptococcus equinus TaxID=3003601 RepID=A0ABY7JM30_9FIRM|nr:L-serine ammonia-lyase, iron-sulfur-dependent, subunit alpha [Peptostreptococcus sp. CBA3647]WAW14382.1 L-serine ammonia-lyase, iron-sulfur-dependent, subunit alpha [Peptostreptococcus sp. CBA3647]